jgi:hypothetical protein
VIEVEERVGLRGIEKALDVRLRPLPRNEAHVLLHMEGRIELQHDLEDDSRGPESTRHGKLP